MADQIPQPGSRRQRAARPGPPVAGAALRPTQPARTGDGHPARRSPQRVQWRNQLPPQAVGQVRIRRGGPWPRLGPRAMVEAGTRTGLHRGECPRRREPGGTRGDQAGHQRVQPGQTSAHPRVAGQLRTLATRLVRRQCRELEPPSSDGRRVRPARRGDRHPDHRMGRAHSRPPDRRPGRRRGAVVLVPRRRSATRPGQ